MVVLHGGPGAGSFCPKPFVTSWEATEANVKDVRDFARAVNKR